MKDHVTLKTGVMILKIQLLHQRNKLHEIYIYIYTHTVYKAVK